MKKILVLTLSLMGATSMAQSAYFQSGFLGGVHMGAAYHKGKFNQSYYNGIVLNRMVIYNQKSSFTNFFGGASLGYRHLLPNHLTLGLMLQADTFDNNSMTFQTNGGTILAPFNNEYRRSFTIMPELVFGYVWGHKGRLHTGIGFGAPYTRFEAEFTNVLNSQTKLRKNLTQNGFMTSVHVDYGITERLSLNFTMGYEWYSDLKATFGPEFTPGVNGTQYSTKVKLDGAKGQLGLSYRL